MSKNRNQFAGAQSPVVDGEIRPDLPAVSVETEVVDPISEPVAVNVENEGKAVTGPPENKAIGGPIPAKIR